MEQLADHHMRICTKGQTQASRAAVHRACTWRHSDSNCLSAHCVLRPACKQIKSLAWKQSGAKLKLLLDCFAGKSFNPLSKTAPTIQDQEHSSMWMGQCLWQHPQARDYGAIIGAWIDPRLLDHMYKSMKSTNIPMKPATKPSTIHHD